MSAIRVLIVDDSGVVRHMMSDIVAGDPGLEVAGTAPDGLVALAKIPQLNPDLVTLDVDMPEMDGLETLKAIRQLYPRLPVVVVSSLTQRGASTTLDCLYLGANDYITKPSAGDAASRREMGIQLVSRIKALAGPKPAPAPAPPPGRPAPPAVPRPASKVRVVCVGASTGGPQAVTEFLSAFPRKFPVPVLIAQHMPPLFTRTFAERLSAQTPFVVREGETAAVLGPGSAWVAPGDFHMEVCAPGPFLRIHQGPPENSCRPAVDVLFRSAAQAYGAGVLAVVLTGMGQDGLRGGAQVRELGGRLLAQDEASSVVWGMPGSVVHAGLAELVLPPRELGLEVVRRVGT